MNTVNLKRLSSKNISKKRMKKEIFIEPTLFNPPDILVKVQPRKKNYLNNDIKSTVLDKNIHNGKKTASPKCNTNEKLETKLTELNRKKISHSLKKWENFKNLQSKATSLMIDYNSSNINQQQILVKSEHIAKNQAYDITNAKEQRPLHSKISKLEKKTNIPKLIEKKETVCELKNFNSNKTSYSIKSSRSYKRRNIEISAACSRDSQHDIDNFISIKKKNIVITYSASQGRTVKAVIDEKDRTADKQEGTSLKNKNIIRSHAICKKKNDDQKKTVSSSRAPVIIKNNLENFQVPMNEMFIFGTPKKQVKKPESRAPNFVRSLVVLVTDCLEYANSPHIKQTESIERKSLFSKNTDSSLESQICDDNKVDKIKLEKSENIHPDILKPLIECDTVEEMNVSSKKANMNLNAEASKSPEFQDLFSPDADFFYLNDDKSEKTKLQLIVSAGTTCTDNGGLRNR